MKQQPQIAQLILNFKGPLVHDTQVEEFNDLLTLQSIYSYQHKMVWVKSEESFYYIITGDGSQANNWKKLSVNSTIELWNNSEQYSVGDVVHIGPRIYKAINPVAIGESPLTSSNWYMIAGSAETNRFAFENAGSVVVYTDIPNPTFDIYLCDLMFDSNSDPILNNHGLLTISNEQLVSVPVVLRDDLPYNGGYAYEFWFGIVDENSGNEQDLQLSTGVINIK